MTKKVKIDVPSIKGSGSVSPSPQVEATIGGREFGRLDAIPEEGKIVDVDVASLSHLDDGDPVSSWDGAVQDDPQYQPKYHVGEDGIPYVDFDGVAWMYGPPEMKPSSMSQDHTIYAVMERVGRGSAACMGWNDTSQGGSFQNGWSYIMIAGRRWAARWGGDGGTGNRDRWNHTTQQRYCFASRIRAGWWHDVQFSGTSQGGHVAGTGVPPNEEDVPPIIGSVSALENDPPVSSVAQFRLFRLIMFDRLLTPMDHLGVQEILENKYNTIEMQ